MNPQKYSATLPILAIATFVAGCAGPQLKPSDYTSRIQSVGVVSLLPADSRVQMLGLTVFGNERRAIPLAGELNVLAADAAGQRLRDAQPKWSVKRVEPGALQPAPSAEQVATVAKKAGVDALVLIQEGPEEKGPNQGVSVLGSKLPGLKATWGVVGNLRVSIYDKEGTRLATRWKIDECKADIAGFTGDVSQLNDPAVTANTKQALRACATLTVNLAMKELGY
jgi:hypothetical protein